MKRILALILAVLMLTAVLVGCGDTPDNNDGNKDNTDDTNVASGMSFKAGFGRYEVEIKLPQKLSGDNNDRPATGFYDELYVSCTAVRDSDGNTVLLMGVDAMYLFAGTTDPIREEISKETGVPVANIIINHSHTHFAPHFLENLSADNFAALKKACLDSAKRAIVDLAPATIYTGTIETEGLTFTRRFVDKNGNGRYEPQTRNEVENPVDENVYVINFAREGDKKDIVLANFASHTTVSSGTNFQVSSSYYGPTRDTFERELNKDAVLCLFQGAAGNSIPKAWVETKGAGQNKGLIFDPNFIGSDKYGEKLAGYINECLENNMTKHESDKGVAAKSKSMSLVTDQSRNSELTRAQEIQDEWNKNGIKGNTKRFDELCEKYNMPGGTYEAYKIIYVSSIGGYQKMEVNAVSIGDIGIGSAGYEMLSETGKEIHEGSPFEFNFVLGYTNGEHQYIPQEDAFENGGYEVYTCWYVKGTAEKIRAEVVKLLEKLYEGNSKK